VPWLAGQANALMDNVRFKKYWFWVVFGRGWSGDCAWGGLEWWEMFVFMANKM